jgi:hypothetical protein
MCTNVVRQFAFNVLIVQWCLLKCGWKGDIKMQWEVLDWIETRDPGRYHVQTFAPHKRWTVYDIADRLAAQKGLSVPCS